MTNANTGNMLDVLGEIEDDASGDLASVMVDMIVKCHTHRLKVIGNKIPSYYTKEQWVEDWATIQVRSPGYFGMAVMEQTVRLFSNVLVLSTQGPPLGMAKTPNGRYVYHCGCQHLIAPGSNPMPQFDGIYVVGAGSIFGHRATNVYVGLMDKIVSVMAEGSGWLIMLG